MSPSPSEGGWAAHRCGIGRELTDDCGLGCKVDHPDGDGGVGEPVGHGVRYGVRHGVRHGVRRGVRRIACRMAWSTDLICTMSMSMSM